MTYIHGLTRRTIALALDHRDPSGLVTWIRTLANGLGHDDLATDMPSPPFRTWLRSAARGPLAGITTQELLEGLALPTLAAIALSLAAAFSVDATRPHRPVHHPGSHHARSSE